MSDQAPKSPPAHQIALEALADARKLVKHAAGFINQDAKRITVELRESIRLAAGSAAALAVGGILLGMGLVHALVAMQPGFPLWAGFLLVGSAMLVIGVVLYANARAQMDALEPIRKHAGVVAEEAVHVADQVNEAVVSTTETIQSGVYAVKSALDSVRHATDLNYQVKQRPWVMFATAAGVGFVGGALLNSLQSDDAVRDPAAATGTGNGSQPSHPSANSIRKAQAQGPGILSKLGEVLAPQAELARELAIGALFSLARDIAHDAVAKPMAQPVDDFFNDAARKFGGKPLAPGALNAFGSGAAPEESRHAR
jgi:ElaB/YqjD/DUF883 family membrane-anchored ribosome-binding protein